MIRRAHLSRPLGRIYENKSLERRLAALDEAETQEEPPETEAPTKLNIEKQIMKARHLMED